MQALQSQLFTCVIGVYSCKHFLHMNHWQLEKSDYEQLSLQMLTYSLTLWFLSNGISCSGERSYFMSNGGGIMLSIKGEETQTSIY